MFTNSTPKPSPSTRCEPGLSVVVPTRNERDNVGAFLNRLERARPAEVSLEVIFVDDSDDDTPTVIAQAARYTPCAVRVIHRPVQRRAGGLGGAVLDGIRRARKQWVCVMDADLQHPPETVAGLLREARRSDADVVVASRYCAGGEVGSFSAPRRAVSRMCTLLAQGLFPRRLHGLSDPLSGFFILRRSALDPDEFRPRGFKILLEILLSGQPRSVSEVAFRFDERLGGDSKASAREGVLYVRRLIELRWATLRRGIRRPSPDRAPVLRPAG